MGSGRFNRIAAAAVVVAVLVVSAGASSSASIEGPRERAADGAVTAKASALAGLGAKVTASLDDAVEGDRYRVTVKLKAPKRATRVTLQKFDPPEYSFQDPEWVDVRKVAVRGRQRISSVVVATDPNSERYRAIVRYKKSKPVRTRPVSVRVWRWIALSEYTPYYETGGTTVYGTFGINGRVYTGFGPYLSSHVGSWEARFTPGRHCVAFRGTIGLDDDSDDGSSGTVAITADDESAYQSPSLTPGMDLAVTVALAKPYRLGIQLRDTSPGGTESHDLTESYPAIGDPALLCSGV